MSARNVVISGFKTFLKNVFETAESWCIVGLTDILCLLQGKNSIFLETAVFIVA